METDYPASRHDSSHSSRSPSGIWIIKPYANVLISIILFAVISGTAFFLGYRDLESARRNILAEDAATAKLLADLIQEHNMATVGILQSYAFRPLLIHAVKSRDLAEVTRHLSSMQKNSENDLTFITDKRGILWANFPVFPEAFGADLSYRDWYKGVSVHWAPYISTVFKLIVGDKPLAVAVSVPITDETGDVIGILSSSQRLDYIRNMIETAPVDPHATAIVIDQAGNVLYSNKSHYSENVTAFPFAKRIESAVKEKKQRIEMNGSGNGPDETYFTIAPLAETGWTVIIGRAERDIFHSQINHFFELGAVSFLLFLLIGIFLTYFRKVSLFKNTEELLQAEIKLLQKDKTVKSLSARNEAILSAVPEILMEEDTHQVYIWSNAAGIRFFGDDVIGQNAAFYLEGDQNTLDRISPSFDAAEDILYSENWQRQRTGEKRLLAWRRRVLRDENGQITGALSSARDITELKKAEDSIKASLIEKDILLKEIHHRVKNNMQIISSLLRLQSHNCKVKNECRIFQEGQDRINAMASVHTMLYKSKNLNEINFGEYIRELARHLYRSYNTNPETVSLSLQAADVMLSINEAVPCGLIINELLSNALKYAFPGGRKGEIRIEMSVDDNGIRIVFADDGVGLPKEMDFQNSETLGLQLVRLLVGQLGGTIERAENGATKYVIRFKKKGEK